MYRQWQVSIQFIINLFLEIFLSYTEQDILNDEDNVHLPHGNQRYERKHDNLIKRTKISRRQNDTKNLDLLKLYMSYLNCDETQNSEQVKTYFSYAVNVHDLLNICRTLRVVEGILRFTQTDCFPSRNAKWLSFLSLIVIGLKPWARDVS